VASSEGSSRRYPVMVWIHGGVFTVGESDDYIPMKLVQHGVIVVTIKLSPRGFRISRPSTIECRIS
jgi:carboxylesterase type B